MIAVPETPSETINFYVQLAELALRRADYDAAKSVLDTARADFDTEHALLIDRVAALKASLDSTDRAIRVAAERQCEETGEAKPAVGIEVKNWDGVVYDADTARSWCLVNMPALLVLNASAYEKVFKEVHTSKLLSDLITMPGQLVTTAKASLARDLSSYLKKE